MNEVITPLMLSLQVATVATVAVALVGTACGFLLARMEFKGKSILDALCTLPLVLPPTVIGYYLLDLFGRQGTFGQFIYTVFGWNPLFTWQAAAIASFVIALPIMVKTSRAAIESVDSVYEQVAFTLGKTRWQTAMQVTLPLASKGILAGLALSFARALGEFGATLMVAGNIPGKTQTMPLAIYQASQSGEDGLARLLVITLTVISLLVLVIINRAGARW